MGPRLARDSLRRLDWLRVLVRGLSDHIAGLGALFLSHPSIKGDFSVSVAEINAHESLLAMQLRRKQARERDCFSRVRATSFLAKYFQVSCGA